MSPVGLRPELNHSQKHCFWLDKLKTSINLPDLAVLRHDGEGDTTSDDLKVRLVVDHDLTSPAWGESVVPGLNLGGINPGNITALERSSGDSAGNGEHGNKSGLHFEARWLMIIKSRMSVVVVV